MDKHTGIKTLNTTTTIQISGRQNSDSTGKMGLLTTGVHNTTPTIYRGMT